MAEEQGHCLLFLDSVDEAKIRRPADFYAALNKVVAAIGPAIARAQVYIQFRISEWQPETDLHEVLSSFGTGAARDTDGGEALLVVQRAPIAVGSSSSPSGSG